ncbi:phospholipase A1 2-like [Lucilia sericata]|uniref:phospholipase A1 2-like n=1 Tax=Lucilia sericata TaxID=13632 RepID=UPI0018A85CD0|nr:phospholipase A1 2-like [Lucilia sericata]
MRILLISLFILSATRSLNAATTSNSSDTESIDAYDYDEDYPVGELNDNNDITPDLEDENDDEEYCEWQKCDKDLRQERGFRRFIDVPFLKKLVRNLSPFSRPRLEMHFYLFKREFPDCGKELIMGDINSLLSSGLNASVPTRIIIHGWMSQSRGSFNRDIKNAYLQKGDFNVIIADWSSHAANINYFHVVRLIETFGAHLARFTNYLAEKADIKYDDIYLIGHSLGAQIAGAAGKRSWPNRYNTIFALDPAGPKFRKKSTDFRIDPTDAKYVESIQTSRNLGFLEPTGNATFYPNFGSYQKKCYYVGCSHIRAYKMFVESLNSPLGFYGIRCLSRKPEWDCDDTQEYRMGGEPSIPKSGIFYVDTNAKEPYALGRANTEK